LNKAGWENKTKIKEGKEVNTKEQLVEIDRRCPTSNRCKSAKCMKGLLKYIEDLHD